MIIVMLVLQFLMSFLFFRYSRKKRPVWIKPGQTEEWWKNLESSEMSPEEWKINLRLSKEDFYKVVDTIRPLPNYFCLKYAKIY